MGDGNGSSFKKGSGTIDFGDGGETESDTGEDTESESVEPVADESRTRRTSRSEREQDRDRQSSNATTEQSDGSSGQYPYFVRRNTVGEERNRRMELHLRDEVADEESDFRSRLADELGTDEVAKTDAREMALKYVFEGEEEGVAELMKNEGYGELD